jgi:hypothetical protein
VLDKFQQASQDASVERAYAIMWRYGYGGHTYASLARALGKSPARIGQMIAKGGRFWRREAMAAYEIDEAAR